MAASSAEMASTTLDEQIHRLAEILAIHYRGRVSAEEVRAHVAAEAERYHDARVTQYVPALIEHAVRERLRPRKPLD